MKTRILTGIVFALVVAAFVAPGFFTPLAPLALFAAVMMAGIREMDKALAVRIPDIPRSGRGMAAAVCGLVSIPFAIRAYAGFESVADGSGTPDSWGVFLVRGARWDAGSPVHSAVALLIGFAAATFIFFFLQLFGILVEAVRSGTARIGPAGASAASAAYVAFSVFCAVAMLYSLQDAMFWIIPALAAPWITDVAAYFVGSLAGRHKIVPDISPKKTWEGCIGGMFGCMAVMPVWILQVMPDRMGGSRIALVVFALVIGMLAGTLAQAGDWFASAFKRWCGIKDFGTLLPGHGGILDRFDSVLFTLPLFFAAAAVVESL
ncbi:MAG: phosphatidate cytidylyltransferase [Clostridia bacterium]|nr:phosphatidate cytidylyltransferase [Clostridia bacterium]